MVIRGKMTSLSVKITSANCQGLRDAKKHINVINYLAQLESNILCLQNTHWVLKTLWPGECLINGYKTNARGVSILIRKNFEYKVSCIQKHNNGNFLSIILTTNGLNFRIINIYAPNNDSPHFFEFLKSHIQQSDHDYCIVCGDLNLVLDPEMDSYNYTNLNNPQARRSLLNVIDGFDLNDIFHTLHKEMKQFT